MNYFRSLSLKAFRIVSFGICSLFVLVAVAQGATERLRGEEKLLRGRLGVGFTNQLIASAGSLPSLSAKYYTSRSMAVSVSLGFSTSSPSTLLLGGKFYKNLFYESNLVFYGGGGLGLISQSGKKVQCSLFLGSEFFFAQVPSLGFSVEFGVKGDNVSGNFAIRSSGDSFLTGGMHFYF